MSVGVLSSRYAEALLRYVEGTGAGRKVYDQARAVFHVSGTVRELEKIISDSEGVSPDEKMRLLESVLAPEGMVPELADFFRLLIRNGRGDLLRFTLASFMEKYEKALGNIRLTITTAVPLDDRQLARTKEAVSRITGKNVSLDTVVEPEIIGGAVIQSDSHIIDASVRTQLETVRRELTDMNKRII